VGAETLGRGRIDADFHCCGTVAVEMDRLNRCLNGCKIWERLYAETRLVCEPV